MNTPELELEQKLENIFSAGLEMLRGGWDVQQATQILLALFFNKRLLALIAERKIDFLTLSAPNALLWENLKHESMPDPARTLCLFEEVLLELIQQNRALSHIFRPLLEALKTQALSDYLWQTIQHLQEADFSSKQFSVEIFGRFFTQSLYRSALKSGKTGADISTPVFINKLLVALSQPKRGELIYDPCVGQGNTFIEFYRSSSRLQFIGQELDFNVWAIAQMNLWANGVYDADILCQNSLFETPYDFPPADIAVGHFPFGLFVDTQTVKEQPYIAIPFAVSNTPSLDGNGLFIQRMLYQLHEKGKACIVLPLQVTYKDRLDRRLREFLLRRDWIDTIIALPAGLLPTTGTPVSVWVIQKSKPAHRKDKVLFINAFNIESQARTRLSKSLADAQIGEIFQAYKLGEAKADSFLSDNVAFVPTIYVMDNEYNLNPKQYASRFIQKLNQLRTTQQLIPLNQLFGKEQAFVWFDTQNPPPRPLPFVQPSNLGNSFAEYPLAPNILQTSEQVGIFEGRLLNSSALLVYTKSNKLKVSYYEHNQDAVLVSKDILVLFIEDPHLNIEYLLLQLHADLFAEQMLLYKSDHLDTELSEREFVHLQIILPERLIQDRIVRETKTQLLRAEENKVEALRQTLNLGKQKSQNEQYKIISSLQHELGNRLPAVLTEFKNLKDFIHDKIDAQTPLDWKEPIFPLFEDENPDTVDTLADTVRRIEQLLRNTLNTLDATSSIISADKTRLQLQPVSVKNFLENIASLYKNEPHFSIQIEIETDEAGKEIDFVAKMDVTQMETLFVNFIENAKRHGFVHDKKYLIRFRVGLSEDEKELIIEYENDGRPFPSNFSFEDFISFGNYAGETGHSGIGGYLINQIIENHEGTLSYRTQIDRNDPFKVQFEICLPYVRR